MLFPGQGSQVDGMRARVAVDCPELLDLADALLGQDAFANAESSTRLLQPAIYCASIAGWRRATKKADRWQPAAYAGHSLGEIAALAAAGVISTEDGLRLVALRGTLMERMAGEGPTGGMLAILGPDFDIVKRLAAEYNLDIAGDNAPGQTVVSGDIHAIERLTGWLEQREIEARLLPIKGAFHTPAMEPIRLTFQDAVRELERHEPALPVFSSVTCQPFDDIPRRLGESLTHAVRWRETVLGLHAAGARRFIEVGPGKKLTRMAKRTVDNIFACTVDNWNGNWAATAAPIVEEAA
jgi:malonyl CoA-acyl carrier protein transacylase